MSGHCDNDPAFGGGIRERAEIAAERLRPWFSPGVVATVVDVMTRFAEQEIALAEARAEIGRAIEPLFAPPAFVLQRDSGDETRVP